eukprot:jgi/Orpsp1_1/1179479/evm.model.c7180000069482.1
MSVSFSANGKEVKRAYDSILNGDSTFEWALYGYEDGTNEIELVDSGSGLEKLCEEFDEDEYQYAFARVTDPNTNLPRFVFISWCGESVPFTKKGMYNANTNDVLRFFAGFHIHINARSKYDVDPDEIMKKVKNCSGANYSFHQKQAVKNNTFNSSKIEPKIELKAENNKSSDLNKFSSAPKSNPLNNQSSQSSTSTVPKANPLNSSKTNISEENKDSSTSSRRRSSVDYNPLQPNASRKNSFAKKENSVGSIKAAFENMDNSSKPPSNAQNTLNVSNGNAVLSSDNSSSSLTRRRSSVDYNPLQPNASRKNSFNIKENSVENIKAVFEKTEKDENIKEDPSKICSGGGSISKKISAFQNQIQETKENNNNLKSFEKKPNPIQRKIEQPKPEPKREPEPEPEPESIQIIPTKIEEPPEVENVNEKELGKPSTQQGMTVKALYSYEAQEDNELSFEENEILTNIMEVPGDGWWSGNNSKGQYGMFPSNYVTTDLNATADEEEAEEIDIQEASNKPTISNDNTNSTAIALYDYEAQDDTEINMEEGEIITNIILQDENWGIGVNSKNQQGMFPLNYVQFN